MPSIKKLTRIGFRKWLKAKKPNAVVGKPTNNDVCPIANFLKEVTGHAHDVMWSYAFRPDRPATLYSTPIWARAFISSVDSVREDSITAKLALKILDSQK
jgi:hypothetical protein